MALSNVHQQIIDKLYTTYKLNGFITEDEVLDLLSEHNVSLRDTDNLIGILLSKGIIFSTGVLDESDDFKDYRFVNYESIFSEIIQIDPDLKHIINYISNIRPPRRNEFDKLYLQAKNGNSFAKNRILEMYMRQAVQQALNFSKKCYFPIADCIQEAFVGLILGFEKYDINRSQKFPKYIYCRIRERLNNENIYYNIYSSNKDINKLIISDDGLQIENTNQNITNILLNNKIKNILDTIPLRESKILLMRFGIDLSESFTLDDIAKYFCVTKEEICKIEKKALRRLRHPKRARILARYLL